MRGCPGGVKGWVKDAYTEPPAMGRPWHVALLSVVLFVLMRGCEAGLVVCVKEAAFVLRRGGCWPLPQMIACCHGPPTGCWAGHEEGCLGKRKLSGLSNIWLC